ncbi:MAG: metallophosphatase [Coleofasciculus sp. D1-CHI-01]|uniref:metallophosphatase n=1 Tax=Coleofasciculus sp. D1-CHI-01 TaxID=3068482 RepID=UPI0032F14AB1
METWAILSGIEGNIVAYEAVISDIQHQNRGVNDIYILGDFISSRPESEQVVRRIRSPKPNECLPKICTGWWEEQCLILHGLAATGEPTQLIENYGADTVKLLWDAVSRQTVEWIRRLDFGFLELDCLLIHGSSVSVDDELTPQTPPWQMCDRLMRVGATNLFCGRSGLTFEYQLQGGSVSSQITTLEGQQSVQTATASPRRVIGVGNVGREPGKATYTFYEPDTNRVDFRTIRYG